MNDNVVQISKLLLNEKSVTVTHTQRQDDRNINQEITFTIRPFPFGTWPKVFAHFDNILANVSDIMKIVGQNTDDVRATLNNSLVLGSLITNTISTCGEDVFGLLMIATGRPRQFFDGLEDGADGINLALAVVEVNKAFFLSRLQPMFTGWMDQAKAIIPETAQPVGQTSSAS